MTYEVYTFLLHVLLNALVVDPLKQPQEFINASPMETSEEDVSLRVVPEMDEGRYSNIMVLTKKSGGEYNPLPRAEVLPNDAVKPVASYSSAIKTASGPTIEVSVSLATV